MDGLVKNFFTNKVILITGGSSGLGRTFVDFFLSKGARVIVCSRNNKFKNKNYYRNNLFFFKFDLINTNKIKPFIKKLIRRFKKIDILINNAGIAEPKKIESLEDKYLLKNFKVNFFAPSLITKEVIKTMKKIILVE